MLNPSLYSYLQCECIDETPQPSTGETSCRQSGSSYWEIFLKPRPFVKQNNAQFTNVSCFTSPHMCSAHFTLFVMIPLALPASNNFVQFVFDQLSGSLPGESCVGPLCSPVGPLCNPVGPLCVVFFSLAIAIHLNSTHLDSGLLIPGNLILLAGSFCRLFLVCV
jgi:hypothetical protein